LEEYVLHLKICGSQANFQRLPDGFDLQGIPFHQCVIVVELIYDDLQVFIDWNMREKTDECI
jgi:hypothetical protein